MDERYPKDWKRVVLMVSPTGEFHAIGGDREPGDGDMPCPGMERLKARVEGAEKERDEIKEDLEKPDIEECYSALQEQYKAALKRIADAEKGCPCTRTKPCMDVCSCANIIHSGGCLRCCRAGSEEQRKARAEIIADAEKAAKAVIDWDPLFLQSLILDPQQRTIIAADRERFWQDIAKLRESLKD